MREAKFSMELQSRRFHECHNSRIGEVGISLSTDHSEALDPADPEDVAAAARQMEFALGWFADPIYFGNYPRSMIDRVSFPSLSFPFRFHFESNELDSKGNLRLSSKLNYMFRKRETYHD